MITDNFTKQPCTSCGLPINEKHIRWLLGTTVLLLHCDCAARMTGGMYSEVRKIRNEIEEERVKRIVDYVNRPF